MTTKRIEEVIDGRLRPVCPERPLLLSTDSAWSGFLLERDFCRDGHASTVHHQHTSLVLVASGAVEVEDHALRAGSRFVAGTGSVTLWPANHVAQSIRWTPRGGPDGPTVMIRVLMDLSVLRRFAADDGPGAAPQLQHQGGIADEALTSLVHLMEADVAAGCPAGALYGESLCLALATHVAQRYAASPVRAQVPAGGLSRRHVALVRDYVQAHLDNPPSLAELAAVADLSPRHFAVAFRRSVGVTPHRYVLRQRIDAARRLLAAGRMPIADVAAAVGFASQSHFTDVFRKLVGTTPTQDRLRH